MNSIIIILPDTDAHKLCNLFYLLPLWGSSKKSNFFRGPYLIPPPLSGRATKKNYLFIAASLRGFDYRDQHTQMWIAKFKTVWHFWFRFSCKIKLIEINGILDSILLICDANRPNTLQFYVFIWRQKNTSAVFWTPWSLYGSESKSKTSITLW